MLYELLSSFCQDQPVFALTQVLAEHSGRAYPLLGVDLLGYSLQATDLAKIRRARFSKGSFVRFSAIRIVSRLLVDFSRLADGVLLILMSYRVFDDVKFF